MFSNHQQDNWVSLLPLAEFAYNNSLQTSTGKSPFEICYGYNPRLSVGHKGGKTPYTNQHAKYLQQGYNEVKAALTMAQERMKEFYDQCHWDSSPIHIGDQVWLNHRNINTNHPSPKLSHCKLGLYKVIDQYGKHAFKLELPHTMKIHPMFHVSLLTRFKPDPHGREPEQPPPMVTEEGKEEYKVEEVLNSRKKGRKIEYFVKWKGYGVGDQTWEPSENLENAKGQVETFHKKYPCKPRP
ncbi:Transposon Tf2-1 polyprotein, partial [Rhizoctonia solani AG-3 Rhs1AP]